MTCTKPIAIEKQRESSRYHNVGILLIISDIPEQSERIHIFLYVIKSRGILKSHITLARLLPIHIFVA
jgi:hypothetical protein